MTNDAPGKNRPLKAIQQIQLAKVLKSTEQALNALNACADAGLEAIELNGFMIRPTPFMVRALTKAAGMPAGKSGTLDWTALVKEAGMPVLSIHEDLGSIERDPDTIAEAAHEFGASFIAIPGIYRFDFTSSREVDKLTDRLNAAGKALAERDLTLLYHNHNAEFRRTDRGVTAFDQIVDQTDPDAVGFEFDCYWPAVSGVDAPATMKKLGKRMRLTHVTDRGTRATGQTISPIDKADSVELGLGNLPLAAILDQAKENDAAAVIIETHKNWINDSPLDSMRISAAYLDAHL